MPQLSPEVDKTPMHPVLRLLFLGSKKLGLTLLTETVRLASTVLVSVATLDDSPDERGCLPDFRTYCQDHGLSLHVLPKPTNLGSLLDAFRPDLVLVCGWYWKIPEEILNRVPGGFVGLHASLLPRYRGFAPLVWSLLNGETEAGISLFYFEVGLDTGDILFQKKFPLGPDTTIAEALQLAETQSMSGLAETLPLLLAGQAPRRIQDHSQASICSQRKPEDGHIDWTQPATSIHNAIRAQTHPYPGAFTYWEGRKIYLWKSSRCSGQYFGIPGLTVEIRGHEAIVTCGQGAIILQDVQLEGEATKPAGEVLKYGARLG